MSADVILRLRPQGDVQASLGGFLGERFRAYLSIVKSCGAIYEPSSRTNLLPLAQVPSLLPALKVAGFSVAGDPEIKIALEAEAREASALLDEGRRRLVAADARLLPSGRALYPFQRTGVETLAPRRRFLLCDEMGLGKTLQALIALPEGASCLVVCPAAVLLSWQREVELWRPDLTATIIKSTATWRWPQAGEVVLCTYGCLPSGEIQPAPFGCVLIADEAHLLKNSKTQRSAAWKRLRDNVEASQGRIWLLTGTPMLNRPPELWNVLGAAGLAKEAFGSWARFVALFNGRRGYFDGYEWDPNGIDAEVPRLLQKVSLHRRRLDVLPDLPAKRRVTREVNGLPAAAIKACDAALEALRRRGIDIDNLPPGTDVGQLIVGDCFELISRARAALASAKIPTALELVESYEEADEPLVVVSAHREPLDVIGARPGWGKITGETSPEERGRLAASFQSGALKGLAISYKAGGVGITLTRAAHALLVDLDWTPALIQQAEDRLVRIGQTRGVLITRLVATHPLDRRVTELLAAKQALIEASVEASAVEDAHAHDDPGAALTTAAAELSAIPQPPPPAASRVLRAPTTPETLTISGSAYWTPSGKTFRGPNNEIELWAGRGLLTLAGLDPDHCALRNDVGFNATDAEFGHSLADALRTHGHLSDRQWAMAIKLLCKYHRQIGRPPGAGAPTESAA